MNETHESLTDKQTAIRIAAVIGALIIILAIVVGVAGILG